MRAAQEGLSYGAQHTRRGPVAVGGLFVGVMTQLSVPLRVKMFFISFTGFRVPSTVAQVLSTGTLAPPPEHAPLPTLGRNELQVRALADVHELHGPHEPGVKLEKKSAMVFV